MKIINLIGCSDQFVTVALADDARRNRPRSRLPTSAPVVCQSFTVLLFFQFSNSLMNNIWMRFKQDFKQDFTH